MLNVRFGESERNPNKWGLTGLTGRIIFAVLS